MAKNPKKLNPVSTQVKNYPEQHDGSFVEPRVTGLLPNVFRTDTNKKLLSAVLEDLLQPSAMEDLNYSVGRRTTKTLVTDYLPHATAKRQLEAGSVVFTEAGAEILSADEIASALGFNDRTNEPKVPVSILDLPVDPDKFINWAHYYWIEEGMPVVYINGSETETFSVQRDIIGKSFFTTAPQKQQDNRRLELKDGMRIVFRQFPGTLPIDGDLDIELTSNGLSSQALPYELTAYDRTQVGLSVDGELKTLGVDFSLLGSEIQWKTIIPESGKNIFVHLPNYFITTDSDKTVRRWQVSGVGSIDGIKLLGRTHQYTNTTYSKATQTLWDKTAVPWDSVEWDGILRGINAKHYVTQQPGAENRNASSRANVWYHKDTISEVAEFLGIPFSDIATGSNQAIRPIVEFDNRLELFNHGTQFRQWPNLVIKSGVSQNDFLNLPLATVYTISNSLKTPILATAYTSLIDKLRFDVSIRVTVKSGFNTQTAINKADFTDSEISKLYQEEAAAKAANKPYKKILYSVGNNKINWLINPPKNNDVVTVTYFINQVPLSLVRILWLVNDQYKNKILTLLNDGIKTTGTVFETAKDGDAVVIDTPISSDPDYLLEYYWKNGAAIKAQTRKSRTQLPTFELYDASLTRLSDNPKKPLIINSTIIEPVEGTVVDPESGFKLSFLPSQFDYLSNNNPIRNAMYDIIFKHTLHDYSYYTDGDATKTIQGPYSFRRVCGDLITNEVSSGYLQAWFKLKSWIVKTIKSVSNPTVKLDASVWPTYNWNVEVRENQLVSFSKEGIKSGHGHKRLVAARGEMLHLDLYISDASGSATISGHGLSDETLIFIDHKISYQIPENAPSHLTLSIDGRKIRIDVIDVKKDPRNLKVCINGIPTTYTANNTKDSNGNVVLVSITVDGVGDLEIKHQGDQFDSNDHITATPGAELNPFQLLSLGEFSPSRLVKVLTDQIETARLYDSQSWIDTADAPALNGALMVDHSSIRNTWARLKFAPNISDIMVARSLSSWRWYRKFIDKLESNFNLLDYQSFTPKQNLDRILNEMLVGITYSSSDAVTGMAVPTDAMNYAEYLANGTKTSFKINTGSNSLYTGFYGPDLVYVYADYELVSKDEYYISQDNSTVNFISAPASNTIIEVYHCSEVEVFSNIPASAAKLGFKRPTRPFIDTETVGNETRKIIRRHDGSKIAMFGIEESDPRNSIILELETRMYNGCVSVMPLEGDGVETRLWNSNSVSATESVTRAQLEWFSLNNINYRDRHDFVNIDPWSWNYNGRSWKRLYADMFNTYELHVKPWVALGYNYFKPAWWDNYYSWTDPVKRIALENALYHGITSEPGTPLTTNSIFSRKSAIESVLERTRSFPVDDNGNLMDPMAWGYPQPSFDVARLPWEIGSWGPAEMAWKNSIAGQWENALHAIDNVNLCDEFFDASINPYIIHIQTDSVSAKGYNSVAPSQFTQSRPSIGIGALIFEAYREFNLNGETPLDELLSIDCRLQFGLGGFSDGLTSLKMYHTKYQSGSYVPEEDFIMTLSSGVPTSRLRYSAVRIEKDDVGFRVYGFDPGQRYFEVLTPTAKSITSSFPSSRRQLVTPYGEFTEYLDWNTEPVKVYYGDYIENSQALITFLIGLGEFQASRGLVLDSINERGTITDWKQAALDALQWINEFWGKDHNCVVGVATADGLKFMHKRGILDRLDADLGRNGKILFGNGRSALAQDLLITRDYEEDTDKVVSIAGEQIVYADFSIREYDHVIFVRRETKFNDLIVDLQTGNRLDVLTLSARRTMEWTGRPHARGVVLTETGLLPGFDTLTSDVINIHKPEQNAFDVIKSRIAKSNVVPSRATIINELIQNRTMSHLYQQGLQSASGTTLAINALLRNDNIDIPGRKQDIQVNEQWLFTTGNFGNLRNSRVWEVELRKQDFNTSKKVIRFSEDNKENLNDNIIEYNKKDKRWITRPALTYGFSKLDRAKLGLDDTTGWLPNAGIANLIDTDIQVVKIGDITIDSFKNIDELTKPITESSSGNLTTADIFNTNAFSRYIDYDPDDLAWNEGKLYRSTAKIQGSSTSAFDADQWNLVEIDNRLLPSVWVSDFGYIANSRYRGTWTPGDQYKVGDLVEYQGQNYVCSTEHIASTSFINNRLTSIAVTNGGSNYINNETVRVTGEDGQFSTAKVKTRNGKISNIINIVDSVGGFGAGTVVKVLDSNGNEHPLSTRALLVPTISPSETKTTSGAITSVSLPSNFNGGNNYFANNLTVTINGTGSGAVITPVISDQVATTRILRGILKLNAGDLTNRGNGYKVGDTLTATNGDGNGDLAMFQVTSVQTTTTTTTNFEFVGSITGTTLTVTAVSIGAIMFDKELSGTNLAAGTKIVSQVTPLTVGETANGVGRYVVNTSQTLASTTLKNTTSVTGDNGPIIGMTPMTNPISNTRGGYGYDIGVSYALVGGSGTGAILTVSEVREVDTGVVIYDTGVITGFVVSNPGKGYGNGTTITVARTKPRATATVVNGVITAISVDSQGYGKNMVSANTTVRIVSNGAYGSGATAKANIINGQLTTIDVISGGSGYDSGARIIINDPEWKDAVTTSVNVAVGSGTEVLSNIVTAVSIIDGGFDYTTADHVVISDPNRDSTLPNATASIGSLIDGTITSVEIDNPNTANFFGTPVITVDSGNESATLVPVVQSFWNLRATGYGWNVLQLFSPMYVVEVCPNALNPGLNESKVTFDNPHGLTTGDYFVLSGGNDGNYDKVHRVKAKVDDYNLLIEARSTSDQIIYNMVAFKMQSVRFGSKAEYEKSKLTYDWKRGMKAYIDQDPSNTDLPNGNSFNYEFTELEYGTATGGVDKVINHSSYLINTPGIYKALLLDINSQEILSTLEVYDPFKGIVIDDVGQYVDYKSPVDPSVYNVDELGIKDNTVAEYWGKEKVGSLWWDTSKVRYIEYELGSLDYRITNWGKKFADTEVVVYEWVSSLELPTADTPGIKLDDSSGIGQVRYVEGNELNEFKVPTTVYYYWKRGVSTLPSTTKRPYTASTIEQVLDNPDANGVSWLSPVEVTNDSASILISNINDYFSTRDSVILRIEQNLQPEQKHTTGVLVTEGFNGGEIPEFLYGRLRDSLVGEDKYRTIEPIRYVPPGSPATGLKVNDLITFVDLDQVEFSFVTSYSGNDLPVLAEVNDDRPDVKFVWKDNGEPTFGVYRARYDVTSGELLHSQSPALKRVHAPISKNVLKDNKFYAVIERPRAVPDPTLHPLRRYGNNHVPKAQSWFKNASNARRTFIDCVNDFLLKIDVVSKNNWDENLRTWQPLMGSKVLHLDPEWAPFYDPNDNQNGYMQLWDYADYSRDGYIPGNETIKIASLSDLPVALEESPELTRFAVVNDLGITTEVYDYDNGNLSVVYRKNGTIQIRDLSDLAGWDTSRWDSKLWDPSRWDLGQILKALRENIFVGVDIGYFNLLFFVMVKESLAQIPMAEWVFKTTYLTVDQSSSNDLQKAALYYDKKDKLIKDYINEVKPYHSKQIDKGNYSNAQQSVPVSIDEDVVITFIEPELLVTGNTENVVVNRRRTGEPTTIEINQRLLTQDNERLMVRDHVLTQIIVTEEG